MLIKNLNFISYYSYCSSKEQSLTDNIKLSKNFMIAVKKEKTWGNPPIFTSKKIAGDVKLNLEVFFDEETALVPIPSSSLMNQNTLWVPQKIAQELENKKLGYYYSCLKRKIAVEKSAYSSPENRPKAKKHFETISFIPQIKQPKKIVLVDDIITRGATMLGCASILKQKFPDVTIIGFAAIRTISKKEDFKNMVDLCKGLITIDGEDTYRTP